MRVWVLGTLEISDGNGSVELRGAAPRRLLSLLAAQPGLAASPDRLIDDLWPGGPPSGATATLQSHVARLRRALPEDAIRTDRSGYVLDIDPADDDAVRFARDVERGSSFLLKARHADASELLTGALNLWRGTPYSEFPDCLRLRDESERLQALHLDAVEHRIAADLGLSGATPPIAELEALVRWHPLRESFWVLLMSALYRVGRQGDALAAYQRARLALDEELGVSPGPALQEMERRVLAQDPSLEGHGILALLPRGVAPAYASQVALVERVAQLDSLAAALDQAASGAGQLVLVQGEAGAGKSALVREFCAAQSGRARILWGACDPLSSPRPLGPLVDVASDLGEGVLDRLGSNDPRGLFEETLISLAAGGLTVLIVEDLHWADESTLDWLRFLARRIESAPCVVLATYRDEQLSNPVRVMLGDIASAPTVTRLAVPALSRDAVAQLAVDVDIDVDVVYAETAGNAFYVTEVIAAGGEHVPTTVQDAVLARMERLSTQGRSALEAAAVIGSRIEPSLLYVMPGVSPDVVDECVAAGMLQFDAPSYVFRHELVRQAVLSCVPPGRLGALHWQVLERLRTMPVHPLPLARLAEHAEMSGDPHATLEFGVAAGDAAARFGSHREAAFQYGRAVPFAELLDERERIDLFVNWAHECDMCDLLQAAATAWERAAELLRARSRDAEYARVILRLSRTYSNRGNRAMSVALESEVIDLLEPSGPASELALAYAYRAGRHMISSDFVEAERWARRALDIADACDAEDARIHALNTLGSTLGIAGNAMGLEPLQESLARAQAIGSDYEAGRAFTNLSCVFEALDRRDEALAVLEDGMAYSEEHDVHGSLLCMMANHVTMSFDRGDWDTAKAEAENLLYVRATERLSRVLPLLVLAQIGARRGDRSDVMGLLEEARELQQDSGQLQYSGPLGLAIAEARLLEGDAEAASEALEEPYEAAVRLQAADYIARLGLWRWRCGISVDPESLPDGPERLAVSGRHREAAEIWESRGLIYEAARARLDSDDEADVRLARAAFAELGAGVLVDRADDRLRSLGARVPRGARPSTRTNVGGLTDRELDVLELLDEGLRNAEIAMRLHLSSKTVGNHVSAILAKLGASSRLEAVRRARDLAAAG